MLLSCPWTFYRLCFCTTIGLYSRTQRSNIWYKLSPAIIWTWSSPSHHKELDQGHNLIVMGDFNSEYSNLTQWMQNLGLVDLMKQKHGAFPKTHNRSKDNPIDFFLAVQTWLLLKVAFFPSQSSLVIIGIYGLIFPNFSYMNTIPQSQPFLQLAGSR